MKNIKELSISSKMISQSRAIHQQMVFLFVCTVVVVTCLKFLLIPSYHSTDFEVHRNWMAITANLPLSKWYTEATSQWTLDYPPFFAYFELLLSKFAPYFDSGMLQLSSEPYFSQATLFYQRLTVIITDLWYYYAVYQWLSLLTDPVRQAQHGLTLCVRSSPPAPPDPISTSTFLYVFLFVFNTGHLIVDHIHFQYNGLLNGFLLLSMARMVNGQIYWSALWFAVLLNCKHIYLYMAPAYLVYLFVEHCVVINRQALLQSRLNLRTLFTLALIVLSVFVVSFGPFVLNGQLGALLSRLFPFQRGLTHAYWAPNFWALYNALDLVLARLLKRSLSGGSVGQTSGLVQQSSHLVLWSISPRTSLIIVIGVISITSVLYVRNRIHSSPGSSHIRRRRSVVFIELVLLSTLAFFTFGYHVHEKAILLIVPPMIPLVFASRTYARLFVLLSTAGYYSLFPLLFQPAETPIKVLLLAIHCCVAFRALGFHYQQHQHQPSPHQRLSKQSKPSKELRTIATCKSSLCLPLLNWLESLYVIGLPGLQLVCSAGPSVAPALFSRYQFVPLMTVSLYCTIAVLYCFAGLARQMIRLGSREEAFKVD